MLCSRSRGDKTNPSIRQYHDVHWKPPTHEETGFLVNDGPSVSFSVLSCFILIGIPGSYDLSQSRECFCRCRLFKFLNVTLGQKGQRSHCTCPGSLACQDMTGPCPTEETSLCQKLVVSPRGNDISVGSCWLRRDWQKRITSPGKVIKSNRALAAGEKWPSDVWILPSGADPEDLDSECAHSQQAPPSPFLLFKVDSSSYTTYKLPRHSVQLWLLSFPVAL